jgi:6-phospho-beta-glucosidase
LIAGIARGHGVRQIVCCRNGGAIPGFDGHAAVEVPARIDANGARPLPVTIPPPSIRGLMQSVKAYETLTVEAAVTGDRSIALQALMAHPLLQDITLCQRALTMVLEANRELVSEAFFSGPSEAAYCD